MPGITRKPADPWMELLYNLQRRMGRVFPEPFGILDWQPAETTTAWIPAVDVFEDEPKIHPGLLPLKNVVLAPHIASASRETRLAMATLAVRNCVAVLEGRPPITPVP